MLGSLAFRMESVRTSTSPRLFPCTQLISHRKSAIPPYGVAARSMGTSGDDSRGRDRHLDPRLRSHLYPGRTLSHHAAAPSLGREQTPGTLGVAFEDVRFTAHGDGTEIAGWFIPSVRSRRAVVLVHGKDANRTRELDKDLGDDIPGEFPDLAVALSRNGFSVLMIDLRGHGQSGRARFGFGRTERLDVRGAVDRLVARGFRPGRIGVLGISMGAATGIGATSEDDRIGALVADSSFAELASLVETHWTSVTHLPALFSR